MGCGQSLNKLVLISCSKSTLTQHALFPCFLNRKQKAFEMLLFFLTKEKDVGGHFAFQVFLQYVSKVELVIANKSTNYHQAVCMRRR